MNPLIITCFNNLEMSKAAVASALAQDIPVGLHLIDNGSTDGTREWMKSLTGHDGCRITTYDQNMPPTRVANDALFRQFTVRDSEYVLCCPNDVVLPPNLYREMLRWPRGFVTASETKESPPPEFDTSTAVSENTPMAVVLIRSWAYHAIIAKDEFYLDERYWHYASDCDLALRMAACGIRGAQLDLQYFHHGSASWRTAEPDAQRVAQLQADDDRAYFEHKWKFKVNAYEYGAMASDINFKG